MGANKTGRGGETLYLKVPIGTQIFDSFTNDLIIDLDTNAKQYIAAKGGDGGLGNSHYKTSVNRAPRKAQDGFAGQEVEIKLIHKIFCDVGIIGKPNAGKSTFLSLVTNAKPKIADYPFTTLSPNLGVIDLKYDIIVIADIPGLIQGASEGLGLGDKFLKHIERCKILLHLIDISADDIVAEYKIIRNELEEYDKIIKEQYNLGDDYPYLCSKQEFVCLNKCDKLEEDQIKQKSKDFKKITKITPFLLSVDKIKDRNSLLKDVSKAKNGIGMI
jgi:GTP-binding protein